MSCERPKRIANPRYACCIGAANFDQSKSYDGVTIQDYCEVLFGYRGRPPDEYIDVPCGKCFSCNRSRLNGWRIRLLSEVHRFPNSIFVTLTFDNHYLDVFKEDYNKAVRLFLDRIRKKYGKQVRHFFIAEFGTLNGRIHYHGILFNAPYKSLDPEEMSKEWKYGFVYLGWCNEKTCNYIVKYITKDAPKGQKIPRVIVSKGLGEEYIEINGQYHRESEMPYIPIKGKYRVPLPRYYLTKLFTDNERLYLQEKARLEPFERIVDGVKYKDPLLYKYALKKFSEKQIKIGLSPPLERPPVRHLESFVYKFVPFHYLTPWDDISDFENQWYVALPPDYCTVWMHDNSYYYLQTPF